MASEDRETPCDLADVPVCMAAPVAGRAWFRDSVGEAAGAVYRLASSGEETLYLKHRFKVVAKRFHRIM